MLRDHHFRTRAADFVLSWRSPDDPDSAVDLVCLRIPPHLRDHHWTKLLPGEQPSITDQLVLHSSRLSIVLAKMERPEFIHT